MENVKNYSSITDPVGQIVAQNGYDICFKTVSKGIFNEAQVKIKGNIRRVRKGYLPKMDFTLFVDKQKAEWFTICGEVRTCVKENAESLAKDLIEVYEAARVA